ncbi:MAG: ABC transporter substrate-binding protein [Sulfolobales archaeon]
MNVWQRITIYILPIMILIASVSMSLSILQVDAQVVKGPATDILRIQRVPITEVAQAFQAGRIDVYLYGGIPPATAEVLKRDPSLRVLNAPAGLVDFIFNPAPVYIANLSGDQTGRPLSELARLTGGSADAIINVYYDPDKGQTFVEYGAYPGKGANPFAFKDVRVAMNYLIDRDNIVSTIYRGSASPMYTFLSSYDPDFPLISDIVLRYKFAYNPQLAEQIVTSALTKAGFQKVGGVWSYGGTPIQINFIIRVEDERRDVGDQLATALETLGFRVNRLYMTFGPAIDTVYGTDPAEFKWHIYTEGWGKTGISKYDSASIAQFCAPWFGYMPGWAEATFWNYRNATLDDITEKIYSGNFTSKEERDSLYRKGVELCIAESVRAWVATRLDNYVLRADIRGYTNDVGAGLRGLWSLREMNAPGKTTLNLGHLWVYTARTVWNQVGGFQDVYSVDIMYGTWDPMTWTHPFNGLPIPFRSSFEVQTAGPTGKLDVPPDAFIWDASRGGWKLVGPGVKATSKVVFDMSNYIGAKWHHNITITWADVLAQLYQFFDITYNATKAASEPAVASLWRSTLDTIVGYRIDEANKRLEVYLNYWHFEPAYIASFATINIYLPFELVLAEDHLVFTRGSYAYSTSAATAKRVPQLNLVLSGHVADVASTLQTFSTQRYFPANVFTVGNKQYATPDEAAARYRAALSWIATYGNAWISNGPYMLTSFSAEAQSAELRAFRDPTYPFSPGKWVFGEPRIVRVENIGVPQVVRGQEASVLVDLSGPPPLFVKYILRDSVTGQIITVGQGSLATGSRFVITLPATLTRDLTARFPYELTVIAYSDAVAFVDTRTLFISVFDPGIITAPIEQEISNLQKSVQETVANLQQAIQAINASSAAGLAAVSNSISQLGTAVGNSISQLGNAVNNLGTAVNNLGGTLSSKIDTVSSKIDTFASQQSQTVSALQASVRDLRDTVNTLMYIVIFLVILQIVTIALVFMRRK